MSERELSSVDGDVSIMIIGPDFKLSLVFLFELLVIVADLCLGKVQLNRYNQINKCSFK
jgi:hypothetical protein